ncbi:hypothetical protein FO519_000022 [Halicephalobus sp. NKZ332]|nr:hypothetical protein FO519_000022 [Halicephalobus sp. NKZ332]
MLELILFGFYWLYFRISRFFLNEGAKNLRERGRELWNIKRYYQTASFEDWDRESFGKKHERIILQGTTKNEDLFFVDLSFGKSGKGKGRLLIKVGDNVFSGPELVGEAVLSSNGICTILVLGPLTIEIRDPFKRWRVTVRGTLSDQNGKRHFVRFLSWWHPTSDEVYFLANLDAYQLASAALVDFDSTTKLRNREDYLQWGVLRSKIVVDDEEERFLDFRTLKMKTLSRKAEDSIIVDDFSSFNSEFGDRVIWLTLGFPESSKTVNFGELFGSDHIRQKIYGNEEYLSTSKFLPNPFKYSRFPELSIGVFRVQWSHKDCEGVSVQVKNIQDMRMSISYSGDDKEDDKVMVNRIRRYEAGVLEKMELTLPLSHRAAQDPDLAGGKGSNLAKLSTLQNKFTVPSGFIVTVSAFERHLSSHPELQNLINEMKSTLQPGDEKSVLSWESKISAGFRNYPVSKKLSDSIDFQLKKLFPSSHSEPFLFAVRSSAVGEDGSELSSAGQLETFLNIERDDIPEKIILCWASNYRREILNYRIQNGQLLDPPVAVVVQRLVSGGQSGVMFTNDPVKGDPNKIAINVIEGLGEALVSGQQTPDEITISRNLDAISKPEKCQFPDEIVVELAKLGILFEQSFGKPQDVEFAVRNKEIYILQSRDITSLDLETDWEFEHEFDATLIADRDYLTTANVGEVMPAPFTPLGDALIADLYDRCVKLMVIEANGLNSPLYRHVRVGFPTYRQRMFLNLTEMFLQNWMTVGKDRTSEYNLAGQKILTDEIIKTGKGRFGYRHQRSALKSMFIMTRLLFIKVRNYTKNIKEALKEVKRLETKESNSIEAQFELIEQLRDRLGEMVKSHSGISMFSSFTYVLVAIFVRGSPEGDLSPEVLADIATIYAENPLELVSADVPKAMRKLAKTIIENGHLEGFLEIENPKNAVEYLRNQKDSTGEEINRFMEIHGHRGINELLLHGVSWQENPFQLVLNLKGILNSIKENQGYEHVEEKTVSTDELINRLKNVTVEGNKRRFFKFFINQAHKGVYLRESAKSDLVYGTHSLRQSCLKLGSMLKEKGLLSNEKSILFLTINEIHELVENRNPRIFHRMRRREKVFETQMEQRYDFVCAGYPKPKDLSKFKDFDSDVELKGTAVCEGIVTGRARVAKNLSEAFETKPGEILITQYTDIGWSPLFPIIKGLVTEIGGLLSHGSVVAREYGLPCVIAVNGATDVFKTGDEILLDAKKGVVRRIVEEKK